MFNAAWTRAGAFNRTSRAAWCRSRFRIPAHLIRLTLPSETMLCSLTVEAKNELLRGAPADWERAEWSEGQNDRDCARGEDNCWGRGHGFFEWNLPLNGHDIAKARRIRVLMEASSHRTDTPQTDEDIYPTTLQMFLNDIRVFEGVLRNHPHDSRGVLSYLRGGKGAYGYLVHAYAECGRYPVCPTIIVEW